MKAKNLKPMIISALLAVGFGATTVGTSFALFTDSAETNINVTAGKVDVSGELKGLTLYSAEANAEGTVLDENNAKYTLVKQTGSFKNGGTAVINEAKNTLTLTNITPGDKVEFTFDLGNESNVNIKYRIGYEVINEGPANTTAYLDLVKGLETTIGTEKFSGLKTYKSAWTDLAVNGTLDDIALSIYMPMNKDNRYQSKTAKIKLYVEAVQGNAVVTDNKEVSTVEEDMVSPSASVVENTDTTVEATNISETVSVKATIPAAEGLQTDSEVELVVSELGISTDTTADISTLEFDVSIYVDGVEQSTFNEPVKVEINVGTGLAITKVTHNSVEITDYDYNSLTGIISFTTTSFSPFTVDYIDLSKYEASTEKSVMMMHDNSVTYYDSIADAIAVIPNNNLEYYYIKLLDDVTDRVAIQNKNNIEIDLNNHSLNTTGTYIGFNIAKGVLCNLSDDIVVRNGSIVINSTTFPNYAIANFGDLTLKNMTVINETGSQTSSSAIYNGKNGYSSKLTVENSHIKCPNDSAITHSYGTLTINGEKTLIESKLNNGTIFVMGSSTINFNDGTILCSTKPFVYGSSATYNFNGGKVNNFYMPYKIGIGKENIHINGDIVKNSDGTFSLAPRSEEALIAKIKKTDNSVLEYKGEITPEKLTTIKSNISEGDKVELFNGFFSTKYFDIFDLPNNVDITGNGNTLYAIPKNNSVAESTRKFANKGKIEGINFLGGFAVSSMENETTEIKNCYFYASDSDYRPKDYSSYTYELLAYDGKGTTIVDGCKFYFADNRSLSIESKFDNTVIFKNLKSFVQCTYIAHSDEEGAKTDLLVENCELNGWCTFGNLKSLHVYRSRFYKDEDTKGYAFFRPYCKTMVEECVFDSTFEGFDCQDSTGTEVEFKKCKDGNEEFLNVNDIFNMLSTDSGSYAGNISATFIHNDGTIRQKLLLEGDGTTIALVGTEVLE